MAELRGGADRATVGLAAEDESAADAGAEREQHDLARALGGARSVLRDRRDVAVVVDVHGQAEPLGHDVGERDAREVEVDRLDRDPGAEIERARNSEADSDDLSVRGIARLVDRINCNFNHGRLVETRYRALGPVMYTEALVHRAGK